MKFSIQGHQFKGDFYVIDLHGADIVLGVAWQEALGEIKINYRKSYLKFQLDEKEVSPQGNHPQPPVQHVSTSNLTKLIHKGEVSQYFMVQLLEQPANVTPSTLLSLQSNMTTPPLPTLHPQPDIATILQSYSVVFNEPKSLPPKRQFDHHIPLEPDAKPVNVRPYRFPHFQKIKIERQVQQMLESGIVRPSTSPYSSLVLLVKKKDGTWRLCTDYRALNAITLKDRFPIPTVDELLDELGGAKYFSKIDLHSGFHQIRMAEEDIHKTTFRTHCGHFEYLVLPFGLSNAPSTFQATMNTIFRPY